MPELMQIGPDDNDIDPYLTPCPADYPPLPALDARAAEVGGVVSLEVWQRSEHDDDTDTHL